VDVIIGLGFLAFLVCAVVAWALARFWSGLAVILTLLGLVFLAFGLMAYGDAQPGWDGMIYTMIAFFGVGPAVLGVVIGGSIAWFQRSRQNGD